MAGNPLVSKQHYGSRDGDWAELYEKCPIVCIKILSLETQALLLSLCVIICSDTTSLGNTTLS